MPKKSPSIQSINDYLKWKKGSKSEVITPDSNIAGPAGPAGDAADVVGSRSTSVRAGPVGLPVAYVPNMPPGESVCAGKI
jgi:hypothetical protein